MSLIKGMFTKVWRLWELTRNNALLQDTYVLSVECDSSQVSKGKSRKHLPEEKERGRERGRGDTEPGASDHGASVKVYPQQPPEWDQGNKRPDLILFSSSALYPAFQRDVQQRLASQGTERSEE